MFNPCFPSVLCGTPFLFLKFFFHPSVDIPKSVVKMVDRVDPIAFDTDGSAKVCKPHII
jgi:hypothetical protein